MTRNNVFFALYLGIIGIVLLTVGFAATVYAVSSTARDEVTGQTMSKTDISTIQVVTPNGVTHWAYSPMSAAELAIYYKNDTIHAKCFVCGRAITITVVNGNFTSVSVSPPNRQDNVQVVEGENGINGPDMMSAMNAEKIVSTTAYANQLLEKNYSSNPYATTITIQHVFFMGGVMLPMMPPTYSAVEIPTLYYALMTLGGVLLTAAPISWKSLKK